MNCWEFMKCGREAGGQKSVQMGVCPVVKASRLNGVHGGRSAGRACWVVAGTLCGGSVQGSFAEKEKNCLACAFYKLVRKEENERGRFMMSKELLDMIAA